MADRHPTRARGTHRRWVVNAPTTPGRSPPVAMLARHLATGADGGGEILEHRNRHLPTHAGIGDTLAVDEIRAFDDILAALHDEALDHHPDDAALPGRDLLA